MERFGKRVWEQGWGQGSLSTGSTSVVASGA